MALALLPAACSSWAPDEPYYTEPPSVLRAPDAPAPDNLVSICYNRLTTPPERIRSMIEGACRGAEFVRDDYIGQCTLSAPVRLTVRCREVDRTVMVIRQPFVPFPGQGIGIGSPGAGR